MYRGRAEQWSEYTEKWQSYHEKQLAKAEKSAIIVTDKTVGKEKAAMIYTALGKLNTKPLTEEFGELYTDEVIVTDERLEHIKTHHPEDYELFEQYGKDTVLSPDEILVDNKHPATVLMIKHLPDSNLNVIVRLALDPEHPDYKNSIMTFYRIRESNLAKLRKKSKTLYKCE